MNADVNNYHTSSMPALRCEQTPEVAKPVSQRSMPENHKYPQAWVFLHMQDLIFQLAKVDNTDRGRGAAETLLTTLNDWNLKFQTKQF